LARCGLSGQLAGLSVAPGRAFVVSEEKATDWDERCQRLAMGQHVQFLCRPFHRAHPTDAQWFSLVANLEKLHRRQGRKFASLIESHRRAEASPRASRNLLGSHP
jgi:hypothetical protein